MKTLVLILKKRPAYLLGKNLAEKSISNNEPYVYTFNLEDKDDVINLVHPEQFVLIECFDPIVKLSV